MKLNNTELHALFIEKGVTRLFHANTVSTSITFIQQNGLLSRGGVESKGLFQTPQSSDEIDKRFNIWNDVFIDTVDLHGYFPRQNLYGPVSFQFSIDFLLYEDYNVWITKDNPIYWSDAMTDENKYFQSVEELRANWDLYQRQKKMVTIRNMNEPVLFDYLIEVVVDDPRVNIGERILFNECVAGIKGAISTKPSLINKFRTRECTSCFCRDNYLNQVSVSELKKLFLPN